MSNRGSLGAVVWPTYAGLACGAPEQDCEPFDAPGYSRGAITWTTHAPGVIYGAARVWVPKGVYTHVMFFSGPQRGMLMGARPLEHPFVADRAGFMDIDPIVNQEYLPRRTP